MKAQLDPLKPHPELLLKLAAIIARAHLYVSPAGGMNDLAMLEQLLLDAEVRAPGDPFPQNNKFRASIVVQGRPKILYVEGHPELRNTLRRCNRLVRKTPPVPCPAASWSRACLSF